MMSTFWSAWIIVLTVVSIVGLCWLLLANRKARGNRADNTTGHVYDGIAEYDNPLPAWWFHLFVVTIVFSIGYLIAFPGLGSFQGVLKWSSTGELDAENARADAQFGPIFAKYAALPIEELARDGDAMKMGQRLFATYCSQCHGADAHGSFGFPNLADNDWLYGGAPEQIEKTILDGRNGAMPGWEAALGDSGIRQVTAHVLALGGQTSDSGDSAAGARLFGMYCAACHGAEGHGNVLFGAPNLADGTWLYGGSPLMIQQTVRNGRTAMMPAWSERLGTEKVHLLAAYVYSLSQP